METESKVGLNIFCVRRREPVLSQEGYHDFTDYRQGREGIARHPDDRFSIDRSDDSGFTGFYCNPMHKHLSHTGNNIGGIIPCSR